jgi:hypothetical protein
LPRERGQADAALRTVICNLIRIARGEDSADRSWPLVMRRHERLVSTIQECGLFEPRRGAGHWQGGSAGVSVPTGISGVRLRFGKTRGTYVEGEEKPTVIDTGNASITTERVVFQGGKYTREWEFSKLIGIVHYTDRRLDRPLTPLPCHRNS